MIRRVIQPVLIILFGVAFQAICEASIKNTAEATVQSASQGPVVLDSVITFYWNLDLVNQWNELPPKPPGVNAVAGCWLLYAALVSVDGPGSDDFVLDDFHVYWSDTYEYDTKRLDHKKHFKGKRIITESATQTILLVTNTIKVLDHANPRNADKVRVSMKDRLGNETEHQTDFLAIGFLDRDYPFFYLKVNGHLEDRWEKENYKTMGIGISGPDVLAASFEVQPGDKFVIEAFVPLLFSHITYRYLPIPQSESLLLDVSELYPAGLKTMTDEIIPSATRFDTQRYEMHIIWEYLTYDLQSILPRVADTIETSQKRYYCWFFDQGNINWLAYGNQYSYYPRSAYSSAIKFNAPIDGATPSSLIDLNAITYESSKVNGVIPTQLAMAKGGPKGVSSVKNMETVLNSLQGLPYITVQKDATAKKVACVTVFFDNSYYYDFYFKKLIDGGHYRPYHPDGFTVSVPFAVDTEPPRASIVYSVTRALPMKYPITSGPRIGFPTAPHGAGRDIIAYPPRVRENDCVAVIVSITNATIDGTGNDAFRYLPGNFPSDLTNGFFRIDADDASSIRDVTVDLSGFSSLPGMENVSVFDPNVPIPFPEYPNMVSIHSLGASRPDLITATFTVRVTGDRGLTDEASNTPVDVTPTVADDAGNRILDTLFDKNVLLDHHDH